MAAEIVWTTQNAHRAVAVALASAGHALSLGTKKPAAAVFDIDETLLRNRSDDRVSVHAAGKKMYEWAASNGVDVFLLTARRKSPDAFAFAKKQLTKLGYDLSAVRKVYMVSLAYDNDEDSGARFKRAIRERIAKTHSIILNAGDRWGDVTLSSDRPESASRDNVYMGVVSADAVLQNIKFPEVYSSDESGEE